VGETSRVDRIEEFAEDNFRHRMLIGRRSAATLPGQTTGVGERHGARQYGGMGSRHHSRWCDSRSGNCKLGHAFSQISSQSRAECISADGAASDQPAGIGRHWFSTARGTAATASACASKPNDSAKPQ